MYWNGGRSVYATAIGDVSEVASRCMHNYISGGIEAASPRGGMDPLEWTVVDDKVVVAERELQFRLRHGRNMEV